MEDGMSKTDIQAMAGMSKVELASRILDLENNLAAQIESCTIMRVEHSELTEKLENATTMLTARSTELDRSQKIAAEMSAATAQQRLEIHDLRDQVRHHRANVDDLKSRLAQSGLRVARLEGTLERVREGDRLRLVAMGRAEPAGRMRSDAMAGINQERDDVDWVTF
jgi:septal ring factor EnvC (AmiA/AmiB activator)